MNSSSLLFLSFQVGLLTSLQAKEQEFHLVKPDAQSVTLMGEFNQWHGQTMTRAGDGTWTLTVPLNPGSYGYKFLFDGKDWIFDPANSNRKVVDGVENSVIAVTEDSHSLATLPPSSPAQTPAASSHGTSGLSVNPGESVNLEVPVSEKRRADAAKDGNARLAHARVAIAVPQGFDPQKSWPVLVISNTEAYSNIDAMQQFKDSALAEGWVLMAADSVEAEKNKEGDCRYPCIGAAFDYITAAWPGAKDWPVACGGHSGGAKNSGFLAADLGREHHRIIGIFMSGCNWDTASVAYRKSAPPNFLAVPVFLSSGRSDTIATPAHHEEVKNSLRATGFYKVRLESFDGAHVVYGSHVGEALRWFGAQTSSSSAAGRESEFDKIFKKKP